MRERERPATQPSDEQVSSGFEAPRERPAVLLSAGTRVGPYVLQRSLDAGPPAQTWQAEDTRDGRPCALKLLPVATAIRSGTLEAFEEQHRILAGLDHGSLRRSLELFRAEIGGLEHAVLVQEYVDAESIAEQIARGLRFDEVRARTLLGNLLDVLDYLHGHAPRVLHCDLNPSNVLLPREGRPVLIDFDLAHGRSHHDPGGAPWLDAEPGYAAPDLLAGEPSPAADLYALGLTLVAVLTHQQPLDLPHEGDRVLFEGFVHVSAGFLGLLRRMTEPDLGQRFRSVAEVRAALADLPKSEAAPRTRPVRSRWRTLLAALGLAGILGAVAFPVLRGTSVPTPRVPAQRIEGSWATNWSGPPQHVRDSVITWAGGVQGFSSQYSDEGWSAARALGRPDVYPNGGNHPGAWGPRSPDAGQEILELTFDTVEPSRSLIIYETFNAGAVVRIDDITPGQPAVTLWAGRAQHTQHPRMLLVGLPQPRKMTAIRIVLDSEATPGPNQIDAVGLVADGPPR